MRRISDRDMADAFAAANNLQRMYGQSDHTLVLTRIREHKWTGLSAASLAETVHASGHSDPTLAAVLNASREERSDLEAVAHVFRWAANVLERAMPELTRTTPTPEQIKAQDQTTGAPPAEFRPGAGTCEACGREFAGGRLRGEKVRMVDGHLLCYSDQTARYLPEYKGRTIEEFIASRQLNRTTARLHEAAELHDPDAA